MGTRLQRKLVNRLKVVMRFLGACLLVVWALQVSAQSNDPLSKPEVWKKLKDNPSDDQLWTVYLGKDLFALSKEEYKQYNVWKSQLLVEKADELEKKELLLIKRREEYYDKRYGRKIQPAEYDELVQNIYKNFPVIEQYFNEQFEEAGEKYQFYKDAHPDETYSKVKWIEENELKLLMLKGE